MLKSCFVDSVCAVRLVEPTAPDLVGLVTDLERACRSRGDRLAAIITVVPENMPFPKDEFRKVAGEFTQKALQYSQCAIAVIEGTGLKASAMRAIAITIASIAQSGDKTYVEATVEKALDRLTGKLTSSPEMILRRLREQQVMS